MPSNPETVAVVGLGYVGLPLACAFARYGRVVGFDIDARKIAALSKGHDTSEETPSEELKHKNLKFTTRASDLRSCTAIIIAVPTPVDEAKIPDLEPVRSASTLVGRNLSK